MLRRRERRAAALDAFEKATPRERRQAASAARGAATPSMRWADPGYTARSRAPARPPPEEDDWTPTAPDPALLRLLARRHAGVDNAEEGMELV